MNPAALETLIRRHEGVRLKPYRDSVGKLTIGVGRNLDDVGVSEAEARLLLANDLARTEAALDQALPWWRGLDGARQEVLADMGFNLGVPGLLGFADTLAAIHAGRWAQAAQAMLDSRWARQVGGRASELAALMRTGGEGAA